MSVTSERIDKQYKRFRDRYGENIQFGCETLRAIVTEVAGAKAGQQAVSHLIYGVFLASTAPVKMDFSPLDFYPTTAIVHPQEGDILIRNGLNYLITSVDFENVDVDTTSFFCYCLRFIMGTAPNV